MSGIVGANGGGVKGVAPQAKLAAYRVFGCTGTTDSDIILAALERAYADGVQVINQSLGAARQWPQYPTAQASSRLVNKGVVMVASIGNNGPGGSSPDGLWAAGAPGVGPKVIGVASFDNAQRSFTVNGTPYGYVQATGAPTAPTSGSLPMSKTGTPTTADDACVALPAGSLAGTAALVRRGTCSLLHQGLQRPERRRGGRRALQQRGRRLAPTVAGTPPITVPVVAITAAQGATLDGLIAAGPTTLDWGTAYVQLPVRHRRADLGLQLLRPRSRPHGQAEHRRAGRRHPVDLSARARRHGGALGHLDVVAARRRRGRADPGSQSRASMPAR